MAQVTVTILKDTQRYFGDVQRKARQITGEAFNKAKREAKGKFVPKKMHPEKALRLAKKSVASVDHVVKVNITDQAADEFQKNDRALVAFGHDIANGRRYEAVLEN